MLKYVNTGIVFQEIPDEVTLAINISNCPCRCPGCHSHYLWEDIGLPLDTDAIDAFVAQYGTDITCIALMGGDADPKGVNQLAQYIHEEHPSSMWRGTAVAFAFLLWSIFPTSTISR
jgi:anaerobic ribonucleoside-triphosphate reductase activating protein